MDEKKKAELFTREIVQMYLERIGAFWAAPDDPKKNEAILALFAEDIDWNVPGDRGLLSWAGPRQTREALRDFYPELALRVEPRHYEVKRILVDGDMAVVLGELASAIKATGKVAESPFVIEITVHDGRIVRYRMHEDGVAIARAAV